MKDTLLHQDDSHSSAECEESRSNAAEQMDKFVGEEWKPVRVHVGDVCTEMPAPHSSDGGIPVQEVGVSVWEGELEKDEGRFDKSSRVAGANLNHMDRGKVRLLHRREGCANGDEDNSCCKRTSRVSKQKKSQSTTNVGSKRFIRLPSTKDRKEASKRNQTHVYAVKNLRNGFVVTCREQAEQRSKGGSIRLFDEFRSIARNIKKARQWILDEDIQWNVKAVAFSPNEEKECGQCWQHQGGVANECKVSRSDKIAIPESLSRIRLREVLRRHKQVSCVEPVSSKVKTKMQSYCTCSPGKIILDLRGKMAAQVQKDLRSQLVEDLKEGNDEAAFVCKQLGIDSVPRADQLELMIAAMPGVEKIVFEGPAMESGLDIEYWMKMHATHCKKGCTATCIDPECYFKVVHHFLLRGFDPRLEDGHSWEEFEAKMEAYVDAWKQDEARCGTAWEKWKEHSKGFLSEPSSVKPKLVVPLLPATRSKHVWRYLKQGIPYKVRLCLDLKSVGVNAATKDWKFRYRGLYDVASKLRKGDWLASVDISRFYLRLPAGPNLQKAQWVQDPETYGNSSKENARRKGRKWRQLKAIGFGLKTAPAWASVVSAELVRILEAAGIRVVGCFIDDLLIAGGSKEECEKALQKAMKIMEKLGIPSNEKTVGPKSPSEGIVFLGVFIQTQEMRFSISEEHRQYAIDRIESVLKEGVATKGDLASIAGVLTWISFVFTPGRSRRQPIYDAARLGSTGRKADEVLVQGELQRILNWWHSTLTAADFVGTRVWDSQCSPATVLMHSDASGEDGWGGCIGNLHFVGPWPDELSDASMLFKEMVPVMIILAILSPVIAEVVFGIAVDNTGVAFAVNKLCCRDSMTLRLIQQLSSDLDAYGHTALGAHVRRERNKHADILSHALFPAMWKKIVKSQQHSLRLKDGYWLFPFVAHCMKTNKCFSACFRMRKCLYIRRSDSST